MFLIVAVQAYSLGGSQGGFAMRWILVLLALSGSAMADVYKCTDSTGRVSFSKVPCGGALANEADKVEIKPNKIGGTLGVSKEQQRIWQQQEQSRAAQVPAMPAYREPSYCKSYSSTTMRSITIARGVEPGMTMGDVQRSWGAPTRVNGSGDPIQWVYRWRSNVAYVYFIGGCVWQMEGSYGG
ncbi:hypothetical protein BVH03_08455 [Pseudomonas sp. PA15(2017)]|uniref:DUF4124 domain-containing protein n=1 Tax=Pseudomonas sp. PA15(2017) TaxID=1932111 RepID=UPI00096484FA|nr:DUF4124 domain-containing protein [Pseudomonas sp. PA15(2017)]OLU31494.1 hypothetical protein BVH03_08455 [Pseudomonas sp. PA15(2017)]